MSKGIQRKTRHLILFIVGAAFVAAAGIGIAVLWPQAPATPAPVASSTPPAVKPVVVPAKPKPTDRPTTPPYPDARKRILDEINIARVSYGQKPLVRDIQLDAAAQAKADAMIKLGFFSHFDPDGTSFRHYILDTGYDFQWGGENLSENYTPEEVVEKWMASPTHKANILGEHYTETGLAIEGPYIVQEFANPSPL